MLISAKRGTIKFFCLCFIYLLPSVCLSQTNTENFAQFEFNFNNPGARAAGAFISIADDATAAEANPAGLTTLIRPEISFELKGIQFTKNVNNFSHSGTATNFTLIGRDFKNSVVSPSFASFVYPMKKVTFAAFRHELVNFESTFYTKGSFIPPLQDGSFFFPANSEINLDIVNWGAALGLQLHEKFSVGASGGISQIDVNSTLTRYALEVFDAGSVNNTAIIDDNDNNVFFNVGFIFKPLPNLSIGGIFKKRPKFDLQHTFRFTRFPSDSVATKEIHFNVPSSIGVGLSYRPTDVITLSFDAVRINYSSLTDDFVFTISEDFLNKDDFEVDNGMEYHFGAEYITFLQSIAVVFRGGIFIEPDNRIHWVGNIFDSNDNDRIFTRQVSAALFQKGDDDVHYTFGLGLVLMQNFQVDLAGNLSDGSDEFIASLVLRL
ncbi:MAG: OmpP1/FadL family transporter [bacterium]